MGSAQSRRERRAAQFGAPAAAASAESEEVSKRVMQMLRGNANPLVAIMLVYPDRVRGGYGYLRSVGFMVERFGHGRRLVITCRHAIEKSGDPGSRLVVGFKSPNPMMLACIGAPIYDTEVESDIAFLIVRDPSNSPTKPFDLSLPDPVVHDGMTLWNAQNQSDPFSKARTLSRLLVSGPSENWIKSSSTSSPLQMYTARLWRMLLSRRSADKRAGCRADFWGWSAVRVIPAAPSGMTTCGCTAWMCAARRPSTIPARAINSFVSRILLCLQQGSESKF